MKRIPGKATITIDCQLTPDGESISTHFKVDYDPDPANGPPSDAARIARFITEAVVRFLDVKAGIKPVFERSTDVKTGHDYIVRRQDKPEDQQ